MVALLVLVPALVGVVLAMRPWRPSIGWIATATLAATTAGGVLAAFDEASASWSWGPRLELTLATDGMAAVMVVLVPAIATTVVAWVAATGGHEPRPARLAGVLLVFVGAMQLLVLAADLLTLLIGWELVAVCSWILISHRYDDPDRVRSATQAYLTTRVGDIGLFVAAGAAVAGAGSLAYRDLGGASSGWLSVAAGGVVVAAAAKSAQLPFSPWLFSAMAGPSPVSALLHSATMVAAGAYALARLAPSFGSVAWFGDALAGLGLATALAGGVVASVQLDLKRALAASTSAQYGLMLVAIGSGAVGAAGAHLVTHAAFKALLFLAAGVVLHLVGSGDLRRVAARRVPLALAAVFAVGAAALAAVPPLGGAWSKEEVLAAAGHRSTLLALGVVLAGALSAFYAARLALVVARRAGLDPEAQGPEWREMAPLVVLAAGSVALGLLWLPGAGELVERAAGGSLASAAAWELPASLTALAVTVAGALALGRRRALVPETPGALTTWAGGWLGLPSAARVAVVDPVLALAGLLARFDDRVVDAGVRAAAATAQGASRLVAGVVDLSVDRFVGAVAGGWLGTAGAARRLDDDRVDAAVERVAAATVNAAGRSRRLQGGLSHQYYLLIAGGTVAVLAVAVLGRT